MYFSCPEEHELNYVAGKCKDKTIHFWTHEKLAAFLEENGFSKA